MKNFGLSFHAFLSTEIKLVLFYEKKKLFSVQLAFIDISWEVPKPDENSTALQQERNTQWQHCMQAGSLPTALRGHWESGFAWLFDVGQSERHSLRCWTLATWCRRLFHNTISYLCTQYDLGGG